jgi:hypothetical protein
MKDTPTETDIKRINLAVSGAWAKRVEDWRRRQQPDLPNMSEAIRRRTARNGSTKSSTTAIA